MPEEHVGAMKLVLQRLAERIAFYEWAYGHLGESDCDVGALGEFVVARSLGCLSSKRTVNAAFDLVTKDGLNLEVKTTSKLCRKGVYLWNISDQRTALEGKRPLADAWIFLKAGFPADAAQRRTFDPFEARYWMCAVLSGERLRASGIRREVRESTLVRLGSVFGSLDGLGKALREVIAP